MLFTIIVSLWNKWKVSEIQELLYSCFMTKRHKIFIDEKRDPYNSLIEMIYGFSQQIFNSNVPHKIYTFKQVYRL